MDHLKKLINYIKNHDKDYLEKTVKAMKESSAKRIIISRGIKDASQKAALRRYILKRPPKKYQIFSE